MGIRTAADEKLESAKNHIKEAISDLQEIVISECWGHDSYNEDYEYEIEKSFHELIRLKKNLR